MKAINDFLKLTMPESIELDVDFRKKNIVCNKDLSLDMENETGRNLGNMIYGMFIINMELAMHSGTNFPFETSKIIEREAILCKESGMYYNFKVLKEVSDAINKDATLIGDITDKSFVSIAKIEKEFANKKVSLIKMDLAENIKDPDNPSYINEIGEDCICVADTILLEELSFTIFKATMIMAFYNVYVEVARYDNYLNHEWSTYSKESGRYSFTKVIAITSIVLAVTSIILNILALQS